MKPATSDSPSLTERLVSSPSGLEYRSHGRIGFHAVLFFAILTLGLSADLLTKKIVFAKYFQPELELLNQAQEIHYWFDGVFGIQTSTNGGALFGMGQGQSGLFAGLSVVFFAMILGWLFAWGGARDRWLTIALGLVSGGILGNFYDRMGWGSSTGYPESIRHHVRDWIFFRWEGMPFCDPSWPNFNIADSLLVVGACLLLLHAIFAKK